MGNMGGIQKKLGENMGFMGNMENMGIMVSVDTLFKATLSRVKSLYMLTNI